MRGFANFGDERLPERFWSKVQPCPMSGCWIWTGALFNSGYAELNSERQPDGTRMPPHLGHRLSFEALVAPIGQGLQIDHLCRQRCCVNPAHLETVTPRENLRRSTAIVKFREWAAAITHCPRGHEYNERNTLLDKKGSRCCKACGTLKMRYRRAAKAAGVRFFR